MFENNRFRNNLAKGKLTFPFAIIFCLTMTAAGFRNLSDLLSLAIAGLMTYMLIELNTSFSLIRTRTTLHASLFLFFYAGCTFLHDYSQEVWIPLLFLGSIFGLFYSHRASNPSFPVFHSFLLIGIESLIFPWCLYITPFIYIIMAVLHSLNARSFFSGIIGLALPYLLLLCFNLYWGNPDDTFQPFILFAHPPSIDYRALSLQQLFTGGAVVLLTAVNSIQVIANGHRDKLHTRILLRITVFSGILAVLMGILFPSSFNTALTILLTIYAITGGYVFMLTSGRFTNILLLITLLVWIAVTVFNIWTDLFNS